MKKNLYYQTVFRRQNFIKDALLGFFLTFCSWPRLVLEVFLRRNMGERYFSFSNAFIISVLLLIFPTVLSSVLDKFRHSSSSKEFLFHYATWYVFVVVFLYVSYQRREEIKRLPSVFDFKRFSLSTGLIHPWFLDFDYEGTKGDVRRISTLLEPVACFMVGFLLWIFGQALGNLLMFCSIFYSFSYMAAYRNGDHFVMDKIDEMICNEELVNAFVEGRSADETRGFSFYGRRPADPDMRRQLVDSFFEEDDTVIAL